MNYDVWMEGYLATGDRAQATFLGNFEGRNWPEVCRKALVHNGMRDLSLYNENLDGVSYWGCRLYDNEAAARKHFG